MRKLLFSLLTLSLSLSLSLCYGSDEVHVLGSGHSYPEALKDAFRKAIEETIGALVLSEILVVNMQLIEDKILTLSAGYIERFWILASYQENDLHYVRIKAIVKKDDILKELRQYEANMSSIPGQDLYAEITSVNKVLKESKEMIEVILQDYPEAYVNITLNKQVEIINRDNINSTLRFPVKMCFNVEKYRECVKRLVEILNKIAISKKKVRIKESISYFENIESEGFLLFINEANLSNEWTCWELTNKLKETIFNRIPKAYTFIVSFYDKTGKLITETEHDLIEDFKIGITSASDFPSFIHYSYFNSFIIGAYMFGRFPYECNNEIELNLSATLLNEDIMQINSMQVRLITQNGRPYD